MNTNPVIKNYSYCLAHVPDLVRYGSKPRREISKDQAVDGALKAVLRSYSAAVAYLPNQVFIGNLAPEDLASIPRPWCSRSTGENDIGNQHAHGVFGEIIPQELFYAILKKADVLQPALLDLADDYAAVLHGAVAQSVFAGSHDSGFQAAQLSAIAAEVENGSALPLYSEETLYGCFRRDNRAEGREDENLAAEYLLENLCTKASGALALKWLLQRQGIRAGEIDFVISCGEEACGDRYQRGGGGMAKAIGEMCDCLNASGMDVKNFCAAPASALITAGALVKAGLYKNVAVVGGGSLAKLGMKFQSFLQRKTPLLDDCLASMAFLVSPDDGQSPILHLEPGAIGLASIGLSTSDEAVYRRLILDPLQSLGLRMADIDKFAPELHNPEIMELAGSGDVTKKNYRLIAALAVIAGQIEKAEMPAFIQRIGMPGFAPTQGHIPSAVPYLGHASQAMRQGRMRRAMFICKASLFLNRLTELFDGVSFILEANPQS